MLNNIKTITSATLTVSLTCLLFLGYSKIAYTKDKYTLQATHSSTSDNIDLDILNISYISNLREHFWPYLKTGDSVFDWGIDFHRYDGQADGTEFLGYQLEGIFGIQVTDISYVGLKLGSHSLEVPSTNSRKNQETYDLYAQLGISKKFIVNLNFSDDYVYKFGLQPAGAREFLNAEIRTTGVTWRPFETLRISAQRSSWTLSDTNKKHENKASMLYGLSPGWPWIWAGVVYEKLEYTQSKPDYWTPTSFRSTGLAFESSFPISAGLTGAVAATVTSFKEDSNSNGNGGSLDIGLDYEIIQSYILRLGFSRIISQQGKSDWTENTYNISINRVF